MAWELVDCPHGTISNGDLIEAYNLLSKSEEEKHLKMADKIKELVELAKYDKTRSATLVDEGGICYARGDKTNGN